MDGDLRRAADSVESRATTAFSLGLGQAIPFFIVAAVLGMTYVILNFLFSPICNPIVANFPHSMQGSVVRFGVDIGILIVIGAVVWLMNRWKYTRILVVIPIKIFQAIPIIGTIAHRGTPVMASTGKDGPTLMGLATTEVPIIDADGNMVHRYVAVRLFSLLSLGTQYFPCEIVEVVENLSLGEVWIADLSGGHSLMRHKALEVRPWVWQSDSIVNRDEMVTISPISPDEDVV